MELFVRPATWSFDLPLFRAAVGSQEELEAIAAAIALPGEDVWVAEADEQPLAFAWTVWRDGRLRVRRLFLGSSPRSGPSPSGVRQAMCDWLARAAAEKGARLEMPEETGRPPPAG